MTRYRYDELELRVDPEPVRLACVRCGRILTDTVVRCADCIERGGNAVGILALAVLTVIAFVVGIALASAAPRPGSAVLTQPARTEAPHPEPASADAAVSGLGTPAPQPAGTIYRGTATWYCGEGSPCTAGYGPSDLVAAIDRKDSEFRKGDRVIVRYRDNAVVVLIVDTCACPDRRVIDLSTGAFRKLAPLAYGVLPVTIEAAEGLRLPETDGGKP